MNPAQTGPEKYLTPADVANPLQMSPSGPARWMTRGVLLRDGSRLRLRHIRLPGGLRTLQSWVDEFLQAVAEDRAGAAAKPKPTINKTARLAKLNAELAQNGF